MHIVHTSVFSIKKVPYSSVCELYCVRQDCELSLLSVFQFHLSLNLICFTLIRVISPENGELNESDEGGEGQADPAIGLRNRDFFFSVWMPLNSNGPPA